MTDGIDNLSDTFKLLTIVPKIWTKDYSQRTLLDACVSNALNRQKFESTINPQIGKTDALSS